MAEIDPRFLTEVEVNSNQLDPVRYPRPVTSTLDTWDQSTQIEYHHSLPVIGRRPAWNVPSVAVTNEPIATVRSSVALRTASPSISAAKTAGMIHDPFTTLTAFKAIPNMKQSIKTDSEVQITFSIDIISTATAETAQFSIFRDAQQISQVFSGSLATPNQPVNVSGSYTDSNPTMRKYHVYDLRWRTLGGGKIANLGTRRTFQVSNLRAQ